MKTIRQYFNRRLSDRRSGMTMTEVVIASTITAILSGGLFMMGARIRQTVEYNRVATEARDLAKSRLEEIVALGFDKLASPSCTLTNMQTIVTDSGRTIIRKPEVIGHKYSSTVCDVSDADYLEVNVGVEFISPISRNKISDNFMMILCSR